MAFDAGAIIARLELDEQAFDRSLSNAERRVEKFEREPHRLRVGEVLSDQDMSQARRKFQLLDQQITRDAVSRSRTGTGSVFGTLLSALSPRQVAGAPTAQQIGQTGVLGKLAGGIGPGITGVSPLRALLAAGGGIGLAALPALGALGAGVGTIGLGASALFAGKNNPLAAQAKDSLKQVQAVIQQSAQPLVAPLFSAFRQLAGFFHSIGPELRQVFAGAAPLIRPLLTGLESLVRGLLPGLVTILHAAMPAFNVLAQVLGVLGRDLGSMFRDFAPVIRASATVLRALLDVLAGILPVVGQLAAIFARALAPIVVTFAGIIRSLEPVLVIVGKVLAQLAQAVLGDLVSAFRAAATLITDISPGLRILATALGSVFRVLENSGVFAILGNALEKIVPLIAKLVNGLIRALAPALPPLIKALAQVATILAVALANGLATVLEAVTPLIVLVARLAAGLITFLSKTHLLVPAILAAGAAFLYFSGALAANPIGATILIITALIGVITLLVKHWSSVWSTIKRLAADAWHFIWDGFGKFLLPLLGPAGLIALGAIELAKHWSTVTHDIQSAAQDLWHYLWNDFGAKILNFFTRTIPGWWDDCLNFTKRDLWNPLRNGFTGLVNWIHDHVIQPIGNFFTQTLPDKFRQAVTAIGHAWTSIENVVKTPVAWVVDHVINGLISAFDWISGKVGGPHIAAVHPFGLREGGRIPGYGGGDRWPALLESGEVVVPKEKAGPLAWLWRQLGIPGFQAGGTPGGPQSIHVGTTAQPHGGNPLGDLLHGIGHGLLSGGKILAALATGNTTALINAMTGLFPHGVGGAVGDLASLLVDIPKTLVKDAIHALVHTAQAAYSSRYTGHYGAGVAQWRGDVLEALRMEGLAAGLAGRVLYQMQTESGGNPNAINLWDSNAAAGDPSRGLLQVIMSTFRAYHWPGTSWNIYNPLANIAAAINYARHRYGPSLMSGGMGMGSGHGYANGGPITEPIWGIGRSGQRYTFGERGPEYVLTPRQTQALLALPDNAAELREISSLLRQLIRETRNSAAVTGGAVGDAINGAARSSFYRANYSARGV